MNDQRHRSQRVDLGNALQIQTAFFILLQMYIANTDRNGVRPALAGKFSRFLWIGSIRAFPARISDKANFALTGYARRMGHLGNCCSFVNILLQSLARTIEHHRAEAAVNRQPTVFKRIPMIQMGHHRHRGGLCQMPKHFAEHRQRRMRPARWPRLQDNRTVLRLRGRHISAHIFPAKGHQSAHRIALF